MKPIQKIKRFNTLRNNQSNTSLMMNIESSINSFNQIISKNPNLINSIDNKGETLLSYAIKKKKVDKCQIILDSKKLDLSYQDKKGNSYLHLAIQYKLEKIAQILIEKGININKKNKEGKTCLDLAFINDLELIINILKNKNKKQEDDINISELKEPISKGRTTKANSKKKYKSNNNSKLSAKSSNNNAIKANIKSMKDSITDSKNIYHEKKINIKTIENIPTLIDRNQIKYKPKSKNLSSHYLIQKSEIEKKSKYKKLIKQNFINKNINLEKVNNTSEETKFKSGSNKDKKRKSNNNKDENDDNQLFNFSKDDDIFCFSNSSDIDNQFNKINKQFKDYSPLNIHHVKDFQEDDEINIREAYERINKKYINEVINSSENNNNYNDRYSDENDNDNDNEKISQIYEDDEYNSRFEENKNSESNDEENNDNSLNFSENLLIDAILKQNIINNTKTRNNNNNEQMKTKDEINKEDFNFDLINNNNNQFSKTIIINKTENNLKHSSKFHDKEYENQICKQLFQNEEENLKSSFTERNISEDIKEPLLLPEMNKISNEINEPEEDNNNYSLKDFLSEMNMQKYLNNFIDNGFDDIKFIIEQAQKGIYIQDGELKEAGILLPGDRAKILIKIQEKANNFNYVIPKSVYYKCKNLKDLNNDININNLKDWLKNLRIDNYLKNFIRNGYHSIELLFLQMESQSPLTSEILKDEIGIDKIGHRSRIINKLKEDGRSYANKLKTSILLLGDTNNSKFCECIIF